MSVPVDGLIPGKRYAVHYRMSTPRFEIEDDDTSPVIWEKSEHFLDGTFVELCVVNALKLKDGARISCRFDDCVPPKPSAVLASMILSAVEI